MKKVINSFKKLQAHKIDFEQLSKFKGGNNPHDLFADGSSKPYTGDKPDDDLIP